MALDGSIIGTLSRSTDPANKSRLVGIMLLCRQIGIMGGPFLVFIVRNFNFIVGPIVIDEYNAAGVFGFFQWSVYLVVFLMLFSKGLNTDHCFQKVYRSRKVPGDIQNRDQPLWVSHDVKKDDEGQIFVDSRETNKFGEKYVLKQSTESAGLLQTPIIIALFSCFCGFSVQESAYNDQMSFKNTNLRALNRLD